MSEVAFHLPAAGYETLARIIPGYLHAGANAEPVSVSSVADLIAMKRPNISANNKFFLSTGILERVGKGYKLTSEGIQLARVLDFHREYVGEGAAPDEVRSAWETIVAENDFLDRVTTGVRVRGNMESEAFARHIALTSGALNKPHYLTGARTVIVILKVAGKLTEDENGLLRITDTRPEARDVAAEPFAHMEPSERTPPSGNRIGTLAPPISLTAMVQITPTTTDDELAELAQKVRLLARLISTNREIQEGDVEIP